MYRLDLAVMDLNTVLTKEVAEEAYLLLNEVTLRDIELAFLLGNMIQHLSYVLQVLFDGLQKDHDDI